MAADATMPVSVVIERRAVDSQWVDHVWRPVGVLPVAANDHGKLLAEGDGWAHFHGGSLDIELFRGETEGYRNNLSQTPPMVYLVLRRNEDDHDGLEYQPFLATVCPYEAMGYSDDNDEMVEGVPMPPEVMAWVEDFVTQHHVDTPFIKRKRKRHEDDYGGKAPAMRERGSS